MPIKIINQEQQIINYILELNLPYSSALKNHMVNMISGIIITEGDKNISKIYDKVTSHYAIEDFSIPLSFKQYQRKDAYGIKAAKLFRNKQQLAFELIDEFKPATETNYLLIDAWYTSAKVILHGLKNGYHTVGRIKSNRIIYPAGIKASAKDFSKHIRKNEVSLVTANSGNYYVYRYEGKLNDIENAVVLIIWDKKDLSGTPSFIISTDISLDNKTIISYYEKRWGIEVSYRTHKTLLGLDEFQIQSKTSIHRYSEMIFLTYTFLEFFKFKNGKNLNLKTLGDTAEYFRNKHLVQLISFAYNCAQDGVTLTTTISNLGLVA